MTSFRGHRRVVRQVGDGWNLNAFLELLSFPDLGLVADRRGLMQRYAQVSILMARGSSTKRIARERRVAHNTARRHCQAVLRRLGVHSRVQVQTSVAS